MTVLTCPGCGSDDLVPVIDDPASSDASDEVAVADDDGVYPWPEGAAMARCRACDHDWSPGPAPGELAVDDEERLDWIECATGLERDIIATVLALEARQARFYDTADGVARPATVDLTTLAADAERFLGLDHLDAFAVLDAETRYLDHLWSHPRLPGLPYERGVLTIATAEDLHAVLAVAAGTDLSRRAVDIGPDDWGTLDADNRAAVCDALADAVEQLCAAGLLPPSVDPLPALGTRVEVMVPKTGDGPQRVVPATRFATGVVTRQHWSAPDGYPGPEWQLRVHFDEPVGTIRGHPVGVTRVPPWAVHVIGSPGRPISTMAPIEIQRHYWDLWAQHHSSRPQRLTRDPSCAA